MQLDPMISFNICLPGNLRVKMRMNEERKEGLIKERRRKAKSQEITRRREKNDRVEILHRHIQIMSPTTLKFVKGLFQTNF